MDWLHSCCVSITICIAVLNDLDSGGAPCSHALIDAVTEAFSLAVLWSNWGIDGQVKVWTQYMDMYMAESTGERGEDTWYDAQFICTV